MKKKRRKNPFINEFSLVDWYILLINNKQQFKARRCVITVIGRQTFF